MLQALLADTYSFWLPKGASTVSDSSDTLFYFILGINIFFSTLIMVLMFLFVFKFRHREGKHHDPTGGHSTTLELTWTIIPTMLVMVIFYFGFRGYLHASVMPPNAYQITANAQMWSWSFTYPNGYTDPELHLVQGKPVQMILQSADVIHDLDIPSFRMKKDAVPGRFNRTWFEPTVANTPEDPFYQVYCAMYCGQNHSVMLAKCIVHPTQADFDKWMEEKIIWEGKISYVARGHYLYDTAGCKTCHTIDGTKNTGPTWKDMYGSMVKCTGGGVYLADDAYVHESIVEPAAKIVDGFTNQMPAGYGSTLKPADIVALTWFMKSISTNYKGDMTPGTVISPAPAGKTPGAAPTTAPATQPAVP